MTQFLARPHSRQTKHKPDALKEVNSRIYLTAVSHHDILHSPYLSRETIQADPKSTKEKILFRKMEHRESTHKNSYKVKPYNIEEDSRQRRKMKNSVLTLPPSTHLPPSCKHCRHDLELCKCRHNFEMKYDTRHLRTSIGDKLIATDSERDRNSCIEEYKIGERKLGSERRGAQRTLDTKHLKSAIRNKRIATDNERDRISFIEEYNIGDRNAGSERRDAQIPRESITSLKSPTYVISRTLTPERDLSAHDIWNILREINTKQYDRTAQHNSEKRVLYDAKSKAMRNLRNNELKNTLDSRRREGKKYLSAFVYRSVKENTISNASSLEYVPGIEMYQEPHGIVRVRNKNMCYIDGKHVNISNDVCHRTEYPMSTRNRNRPMSTISTTSKETGMQTLSGMHSSTPDRKDVQGEKVVSTLTRTWNQNIITPKININCQKVSQPSHKNRSSPIALNKKVHIRKLTYFEIKRHLALLRYPIMLMGRDVCASVNVPEYQAPQFESMPRIWQYMNGWSTNYKQDNIKFNKYLKLLEKQEAMESRCCKVLSKFANGKRQRIQKSIVRKNNIPKNIISSDMNNGFEEKDFKILFQNMNNMEPKIAQEIKRQSQTNNRDTTLVPLNTNNIFEKTKNTKNLTNTVKFKESSPERKTLMEVFMENLKNHEGDLDSSENINESEERLPARKYCNKLTKSKEDIHVKVKATLNKLETDYFYDYKNWAENRLSQSKKHHFQQSSIFSNRKKTLNQSERKETTSNGSPRELQKNVIPEGKESPTKRNTKKEIRKSRNKIVQKYFMDPFLSLPASNQLTLEKLHTPSAELIEEAVNDIKTIIHIPGFSENPDKILIRTLIGTELAVEDILNNIVVSFEIGNAFQKSISQSDQHNLNNLNIGEMISLNDTSIGPTFNYKASVELSSMTLPAQICSIWPLLLNKLKCMDNVWTQLQNNATNIKENKIPIKIVPTINMLEVYLHANLKNNFETQNKDIPQLYDYSKTKPILHDIEIRNLPEIYGRLPPTSQSTNAMKTSTSSHLETLTINYELCSENQRNSNQFLPDYVSDEFTHLFNRPYGTKTQNSVIRLHQDNTPLITFSIPVQVMQKFLKLISNGRFQFLCMRLRSVRFNTTEMAIHDKIASDATENTVDVDSLNFVKNNSSATKLKNVLSKLPGKTKNRWRRKCAQLENSKQPNSVKIRANRKNTNTEKISANIKVDTVNCMKDFVKVLGASKEVLSQAINGQLAKRILTDLREYKTWSEEISPVQAILTLLLSCKPDTRSLVKFRPALVHGIATGRIGSSDELDQECLLVEQDADVDYTAMEVEDGRMVQELYGIAKKTASAHNRLFSEDTERTIDFLMQRKRRLNPAYMRVMAKYVGLGLFTSPANNT